MYLSGYNIEAMQEAGETPVSTAARGLLRQVHNAEVDSKVVRLEAGLNYLLALTSPSTGLIWGKLQLHNQQKIMHCSSKVSK